MTTQNFIDMYGLLLGENAGPVKKMMMVHAAYWMTSYAHSPLRFDNFCKTYGFTEEEIHAAKSIFFKESEKKLLDLE